MIILNCFLICIDISLESKYYRSRTQTAKSQEFRQKYPPRLQFT